MYVIYFCISITLMQINREDADNFSQSWSLDPPSIAIQISACPRRSDFRNNLKYRITIENIEIPQRSPEITITRSLTSNSQSECLFNSCVQYSNSITITLLWTFLIILLIILFLTHDYQIPKHTFIKLNVYSALRNEVRASLQLVYKITVFMSLPVNPLC